MNQLLTPQHFAPAMICEGIFLRYGDSIRIKNPDIAIPNLEKILTAALDLSGRKGFHSTTTRDLAKASGLSMGALYNYLDGKEVLVRMILSAVAHAVDFGVAPYEEDEANDPLARLRGLIRRHVMITESMQRWFYFAFLEVKAFDKGARKLAIEEELKTERLLADAIEMGIRRGLFADGDPRVLAGLIKPLLQDWYLKRWKYRKRGIPAVQYIEIITQFAERALRSQPNTEQSP
jgi:TetR/AcrR family transcriptional regulator, cholesterol catabolism regulator